MTDEIPWKTTRLRKGEGIYKQIGTVELSVGHWDRTIDPYMAMVLINGIVSYSGLHATLADARKTVEEKVKIISN